MTKWSPCSLQYLYSYLYPHVCEWFDLLRLQNKSFEYHHRNWKKKINEKFQVNWSENTRMAGKVEYYSGLLSPYFVPAFTSTGISKSRKKLNWADEIPSLSRRENSRVSVKRKERTNISENSQIFIQNRILADKDPDIITRFRIWEVEWISKTMGLQTRVSTICTPFS